jgi:uncharacterized membrane-anchored protein
MSRHVRWFWCLVVAQAAFLLTWSGWHEYLRSHAPVVRLKTLPVDPQDLLRGDYMVLRYEISHPKVGSAPSSTRGRDCWVVLESREGYHTVVAMSGEKPPLKPGQIAVLGQAGWNSNISYGIETYYVPEGKGTPRFKTIEVEAAVSPTHRLYIKRLLLDGRPYP